MIIVMLALMGWGFFLGIGTLFGSIFTEGMEHEIEARRRG